MKKAPGVRIQGNSTDTKGEKVMDGLCQVVLGIIQRACCSMTTSGIRLEVVKRLGDASSLQDVESAIKYLVENNLIAAVDDASYKAVAVR